MSIYEIVIGAGAIACATTAIAVFVYNLYKQIKKGKQEAVNKLAEAVINHDKLTSIKGASANIGDLMATMQEVTAGIAEIKSQLNELAKDTKLNLYNTASRICYDMIKQPTFNRSMYRNFSATLERYKNHGENGEIDGFRVDLEAWRTTGEKPAHIV